MFVVPRTIPSIFFPFRRSVHPPQPCSPPLFSAVISDSRLRLCYRLPSTYDAIQTTVESLGRRLCSAIHAVCRPSRTCLNAWWEALPRTPPCCGNNKSGIRLQSWCRNIRTGANCLSRRKIDNILCTRERNSRGNGHTLRADTQDAGVSPVNPNRQNLRYGQPIPYPASVYGRIRLISVNVAVSGMHTFNAAMPCSALTGSTSKSVGFISKRNRARLALGVTVLDTRYRFTRSL